MKETFFLSVILLIFCLFLGTIKTPAVVQRNYYLYDSKTPYKVEVRKVYNAQLISVKSEQNLFNLRLSGVKCNEYTRYDEKYSSSNTKYFLEDTRTTKIVQNTKPSEYMEKLLAENENNLYFLPQGTGFYYSIVGELFAGNQSINNLLVEKGYCERP